jgi:hypothetical protein
MQTLLRIWPLAIVIVGLVATVLWCCTLAYGVYLLF